MSDTLTKEDLNRFRAMKEDCAKAAPERGTDDMHGFVEVWRDGKPVFAIITNVDRDEVLGAINFIVPAVEADRVIVAMDAHLSHQQENPTTGKPWQPGEMQKACHEDKLCSTDVITDCLIISDARRDGTYRMHALMYHIDEAAKEAGDQPVAVHWQETEDAFTEDAETALDGLVPEVIRDSFKKEMGTEIPEDILEVENLLTPIQRQAAKDAAAAGRLVMAGIGVALMGDDDEWFEIVSNLLKALSESAGFNVSTSKDET